MNATADPALLASELRVVLGQLVRRLRVEHRLPLPHATVLGRLDRDGAQAISGLAVAERMRPQSMAQTVGDLEADGLVTRRPHPVDGRKALIELTDDGRARLAEDRQRRQGWLSHAIADGLSGDEQRTLAAAVPLLRRLTEL
jgi:DNA-binding MarR family transcriptional regulator